MYRSRSLAILRNITHCTASQELQGSRIFMPEHSMYAILALHWGGVGIHGVYGTPKSHQMAESWLMLSGLCSL